MKILIIVESDETQSATIAQEGHDAVTVAPGQNATIELLASHSVNLFIEESHEADPEEPAAPVVADNPVLGETLTQEEPAAPVVTGGASTPNPVGDTGASVVGDGAPDELKAVAGALQEVNSAVAEVGLAQANAVEAVQAAQTADQAASSFTPPEGLPEDAAQQQQDALTQNAEHAAAAAQMAADAHAAAVDDANAKLEAMHAAVEVVENAASDPANLVTDDHADHAQALLEGAVAAVEAIQPLDTVLADVQPAPAPDQPLAETLSTGDTLTDSSTLSTAEAVEPRDATEAEIAAAIQECLDEDVPTTGTGMIVLEHLNAKLSAKGLKPINASARDAAHATLGA